MNETPATTAQSFGRYTVIRKIGSGGMAEVFLASSRGAQGTEKLLVIKKIHPALASNTRFIEMFVDEARVTMRLNHSNIVQVYAFEQIQGDHFLAMEYVDGGDLHEILAAAARQKMRLPFGISALITAEVAKGLDYAHSRTDDQGRPLDIVHCDVSPQNTLISSDGAVKVTDFGIARARWLHEEKFGEIEGKLRYMSPEQARGHSVDRRSDVFSLGVMLHEMLVGRALISLEEDKDPMPIVREGVHLSPSEIDPSVPRELDEVARRAMAVDPDDRYQSARDMAQALVRFLHTESTIYDSAGLEAWITENMPARVLADPQLEFMDCTTKGSSIVSMSDDEETVPMRALGEVEKRVVVMVTACLLIETTPGRVAVSNELTRLAEEIAYKADGVLEDIPDGLRIYLGLPHSSMEDAICGLRLANDLMDATRAVSRDHRLRIDASVAVNRGFVSYGRNRSTEQLSFKPESGLTSMSSNLLASASVGEIVAGGGVYRLTRREYNFSAPTTSIVGEDAPVDAVGFKVYRVEGARSRRERSQPRKDSGAFLGRDLEIGRLRDTMDQALDGKPRFLKIVGELGIGKSRLVRQFLEERKGPAPLASELQQGGTMMATRVIEVESLFVERYSPLATVAAAIRATLSIRDDGPVSNLEEILEPSLGSSPHYLRRQGLLFSKVLSSPDRTWASAEGRQRDLIRRVGFGLGVLLSRVCAHGGAILVIENAHWMDGQSADVLSELASLDSELSILVLLLGHQETLSDRSIAGLEKLELAELPDPMIKRLVVEHLGAGKDMEVISDQITGRAQGNPFFAGEIIESLIERGIITPVTTASGGADGIKYRQTRPGAIRLPTTMEGLAASHIDALGPLERTTLRAASAIGAFFTIETLRGLVGRTVQGEVRSLVDQGFLVEMSSDEGTASTYRFHKPMVREAAYGGLSREDRHRIHRAMSEELISRGNSGEAVSFARIAWHLEHGSDHTRAGEYYLKGGEAAMDVYSNRRALRLFDRALDLLPKGSYERFEALSRRQRCLQDLGHHADRKEAILEMIALAADLDNRSLQAEAANRMAQLQYDMADFDDSAESISRALEIGMIADNSMEQIQSLRLLAYVSIEVSDMGRALECCNRALAIIPRDRDGLYSNGRILGIKGLVLLHQGDLERSPACLAEALVILRRLGRRRNESTVLSNLALLAQARGNLTEGIDFLERAILIDRANRDVSARGRKLAATGWINVEMGDFDNGRALLEEGRRICQENRESMGEVEADMGMADLCLAVSDPEGAHDILDEMAGRGVISRSRILLTRHRQLLSQTMLDLGDPGGALESANEAEDMARKAGMAGEVVHGLIHRGLALLRTGKAREALAATDEVEDLIEELGGVRRSEMIWYHRARILHGAREPDLAARALARARAEIERKRALITRTRQKAFYDDHPLIKAIIRGLPD